MKLSKPWILTIVGLWLGGLSGSAIGPTPALAAPEEAPRLVLLVAVDQMRYDYLPRFASAFTGGLRRLARDGAVFTNAHLDHYPSVTAVGHAAMLTGARPAISGIVGNDWYDRGLKKNITSVEARGRRSLGRGWGRAPRRTACG
jgi:predicted AlkP superfamily pyrophosphatase or phosphodiesterase